MSMTTGPRPTPHNFLIFLRNIAPWAARLFDGVVGLGFSEKTLSARIDPSSWPGSEMNQRRGEIEALARLYFGPAADFEVTPSPPDPERLPFPVTASKYWNHAAFALFGPDGSIKIFAERKNHYSARLSSGEGSALNSEETLRFHLSAAGSSNLPAALDKLAMHCRSCLSYAQLISPFPGHEKAGEIEAAIYSVKEWGTPATPPAVLQKFVGRIHFVNPANPPEGIRLAGLLK